MGMLTYTCLLLVGLQLATGQYSRGNSRSRVVNFREQNHYSNQPMIKSRQRYSNMVDQGQHESHDKGFGGRDPYSRSRQGSIGGRDPYERRVAHNDIHLERQYLQQQLDQERKLQMREQLLLDLKIEQLRNEKLAAQAAADQAAAAAAAAQQQASSPLGPPTPMTSVVVHKPNVVTAPHRAAAPAPAAASPADTSAMIQKSLMATFKALGFGQDAPDAVAAAPLPMPTAAIRAAAPVPRAAAPMAAAPMAPMQPQMAGMGAMPGMMSPMGGMAGMGGMMHPAMMSEVYDYERPDYHPAMGMGMGMGGMGRPMMG